MVRRSAVLISFKPGALNPKPETDPRNVSWCCKVTRCRAQEVRRKRPPRSRGRKWAEQRPVSTKKTAKPKNKKPTREKAPSYQGRHREPWIAYDRVQVRRAACVHRSGGQALVGAGSARAHREIPPGPVLGSPLPCSGKSEPRALREDVCFKGEGLCVIFLKVLSGLNLG